MAGTQIVWVEGLVVAAVHLGVKKDGRCGKDDARAVQRVLREPLEEDVTYVCGKGHEARGGRMVRVM